MSDKRTEHVVNNDAVSKLDAFWKRNQKAITYVSLAIIIVVGGWWAYKQYVVKPKEDQAQAAIFKAEEYFRMDSLQLALNGIGADKGFLYVAKNFGSTRTGELANFYAGICYLRLKDFDNAIKYLKDYNTDSRLLQAIAWGRLADAYSEKVIKAKQSICIKKQETIFLKMK